MCGEQLAGRAVDCPECRTPHHPDCWSYAGGCSTYACTQAKGSLPAVSERRRNDQPWATGLVQWPARAVWGLLHITAASASACLYGVVPWSKIVSGPMATVIQNLCGVLAEVALVGCFTIAFVGIPMILLALAVDTAASLFAGRLDAKGDDVIVLADRASAGLSCKAHDPHAAR